MLDLNDRDPRFKLVRLSRNFGHQLAVTAGLDHATGRAVVVMDADLQDPPEVALELARRWREGFEVVYAIRQNREGETFVKRLTARLFYRLLRRLTSVDVPADVGDFRLVDEKALDAFRQMRETNRYVRGMFAWVGFNQVGVPYTRDPRAAGTTKYPPRKMVKLALDAIVTFSDLPLRFALGLGFVVSITSFVVGVVALVSGLGGLYTVPGWSSIVVVVSFIGGVQLIVLGMTGLYIGRIYDEVKRRPLYLVRDLHGLSAPAPTLRPEAFAREELGHAG
jgi:dolichol-phosphate mannosyltransferase